MSFRLKTILGVALIEVLLLVALIYVSLTTLRSTNEKALASEARSVAQTFARLAKDSVRARDIETLNDFTAHLLRQTEIATVRVFDTEGQIIAEAWDAALTDQPAGKRAAGTDTGHRFVTADVNPGGHPFGRIEIGFSTRHIDAIVDEASRRLVLIGLVALGLSVVLAYFLGTFLTRRLEELRDTAGRIAEGDIGAQMRVRGRDEVAQAACSMNTMSTRLRDIYEDLSDREERTRAILSNIVDAVVTTDAAGNIESFNCAAGGLFGYSAGEISGRPLGDLISGNKLIEGEPVQSYLLSRAKERQKLSLDQMGQRSDGSSFPMEISVSRVQLENETGYSCVIRDLTRQKEEQSNWRLAHRVFTNSGEAIIVTTPERRVVAVNPAFASVTGYTVDEFVGRFSSDLHVERMQPAKAIRESINKFGRWAGEVWHRRKDGSEYPAWMTASKIEDESGVPTHYIYIFRDISEQKRVDQMKSEFVSTVSHELRTPLTVIKGSLDLVRSGVFGSLPDKAKDLVDKASDNSARLGSLINDILDLEKIESGGMEFVKEAIPVGGLLAEAVTAYGSYAAERGVYCTIVGERIDASVLADRARIMQVLANFISNASKYSPDGAAIELSVEWCGDRIRVLVRDHGPGIPAEFQDRIFGKFAQADSSDSRAQNGTGLGLSISKLIVEAHDGEIGFTTAPDEGTTFYLVIPEAAAAGSETESEEHRELQRGAA